MIGVDQAEAILVAGKSGQLAHALTQLAANRNVPLLAVGRPTLDLENAGSIKSVLGRLRPRLIVNAAAYTAVDRAETEPDCAFAVNRDGAAHLARSARTLGIPFIHVSTDYVFDGSKDSPYYEDDVVVPVNTYGRSKLAGEQAVSEAFPAALIVRTSWLYSPWGVNFLTTMLRLAANRELVRVVDDQRGAPTAAVDLAEAILDIATQITAGVFRHRGGIYHVTAQGETTWHGFAKAIFAGWSHRGRRVPALAAIKTAEFPTAARRPANSRLDCRKIASDFGIRLPHWQDSLDACLDAFAAAQQETQSC